ncbi:MAG: shikimate dehydrogenase [Deltaproteobacteria bacterium]|nr:shikimate dehydrogenase [Deltaproteobacteria bacterium]MDZ4225036.1 shikimate dehydrogenase [bacterium]
MKLLGIIGKPVENSFSPEIYNSFFKRIGLPWRYLAFQVEKKYLKNLVVCMKLVDLYGLNITAPYKETVLPFLDRLDPSARESGAVNTIVRRGNRFIGFNTDGDGFCNALKEQKKIVLKGKTIAVIGAGGAARGIAAALAKRGAKNIQLLNRNLYKAKKGAAHLKKHFPKTRWTALALTLKNLKKSFTTADILVHATSADLKLPLQWLGPKALVCDIRYQKGLTPLLKAAKKEKLSTLDGLWMLAHQASLNLKLWTQKNIPPGKLLPSS